MFRWFGIIVEFCDFQVFRTCGFISCNICQCCIVCGFVTSVCSNQWILSWNPIFIITVVCKSDSSTDDEAESEEVSVSDPEEQQVGFADGAEELMRRRLSRPISYQAPSMVT